MPIKCIHGYGENRKPLDLYIDENDRGKLILQVSPAGAGLDPRPPAKRPQPLSNITVDMDVLLDDLLERTGAKTNNLQEKDLILSMAFDLLKHSGFVRPEVDTGALEQMVRICVTVAKTFRRIAKEEK